MYSPSCIFCRGSHTQDFELRLFARRHAFAGYTKIQPIRPIGEQSAAAPPAPKAITTAARGREEEESAVGGLVATRHHAIDWNYIGIKRARPNKWRVEMDPRGDVWKEWGFAKVRDFPSVCHRGFGQAEV